jgi:hypothetical protein
MTTSEAINEIAAACAKAQLELKPAAKDAENEGFKRNGKASKYSDLTAIIEAAHVYAKHNVAIFQDVTTSDAGVAVVTRLAHGSGQWLEFGPLMVPLGKRDAHGVGSATTYAKRYGLQAAALIPTDDDDGNAAVQTAARVTQEAKEPPAQSYDDWLIDLQAVAMNGYQALLQTVSNSPAQHKDRLRADKNVWVRLESAAKDAERLAAVSA